MKVTKAVITAAGQGQRNLPLQTLMDRDGTEKSLLRIIVEEVLRAGVEEIGVVVQPGDAEAYAAVIGDVAARPTFIEQPQPIGYGHAVYCAQDFVGQNAFLHLVGDHLWVSYTDQSCAQQLVKVAEVEACAVSMVQATRESWLPYYGAIGGKRIAGRRNMYQIDRVIEKPTPTEAEQRLMIPGLRAGHYLCFFGMHVLSPVVFDLLEQKIQAAGERGAVTLSDALAELVNREQYLALEIPAWRYDIGVKYGLLTAQLALALNGKDRDQVLSKLLELLASHELANNRR